MAYATTNQDNSSGNCPTELPASYAYISALPLAYKIIFIICGTITLVMLIMYIETIAFFFKRMDKSKPKDKAKWVLAVYPIFGVTSFVSLIVPRSINVNDVVATCYLAVCIYQFVTMLIGNFGGAREISKALEGSSFTNFNLNTGPCCCCCKCLPHPSVSRKHIHTVQSLVIQYAFLGPLLSYCMAIMWADADVYSNPFTNPSTYMSLVNTIASLVALWGMSITFSFAAPILEPSTHVKPKFLCMQLLSVFHNLQSLLFNVLIVSGVFDCQHMLDSTAVGLRYHYIILTVEVFLVWCFARRFYRDIGDVPKEDKIYADTVNMATNMTGTLLKDLDASSNRSGSIYGPSCAKDIIRGQTMLNALAMAGNRGSQVSFLQDNSSQNAMMNRRLKLAVNDYEPVEFGRRGRRGDAGPPAKQARIAEGNVKTRINRGNMSKTPADSNPPAAQGAVRRSRFTKRPVQDPPKMNTETGRDEVPLPDDSQLSIRENPMDQHVDVVQNGRSPQPGTLDTITEDSTMQPIVTQPQDSWMVPIHEENQLRTAYPDPNRVDIAKEHQPSRQHKQLQPQTKKPQQPRKQPSQGPMNGLHHPQGPHDDPLYDQIYDANLNQQKLQPPRPPSVASSTTSRASSRPFLMLQSPNQSMDEVSRPPSTTPGRAARRAKRAAKDASQNQSPLPSTTTSAGNYSAFQPVNHQASQQHFPQQSATSPAQVIFTVDSTV